MIKLKRKLKSGMPFCTRASGHIELHASKRANAMRGPVSRR
jgi:hypothetical protein